MKLTDDNYFSPEANQKYMSVSQFKDFVSCEAAAMAKLNGDWVEPKQDCFTLGSYVHAALEGPEALEKIKETSPEIFTKKGELKAEYKRANNMIDAVMNDDICKMLLSGGKEIIITAKLFGIEWKSKIDVHAPDDGRITDLKTCKSIRDKHWKNGRFVSFIENYDYHLQMAVYAELERIHHKRFERLEPFIVAVSKEDPPDIEAIGFDEQTLANQLEIVQIHLPRIIDVKNGENPERCGSCKYCRSTKKVKGITHYSNLLEVV